MPLLGLTSLPEHFWDGTGGAIIGGLLAFGAAMVVFFATRAHDLQRMRLEATLQSTRTLIPKVSKIEARAETARTATGAGGATHMLQEALDAAADDLIGFTYELPRKHPGMTPARLRETEDIAHWLGSDATYFLSQAVHVNDPVTIREVAHDTFLMAGELALALREVRALRPERTRTQRLRFWAARKRRQTRERLRPLPVAAAKPEHNGGSEDE